MSFNSLDLIGNFLLRGKVTLDATQRVLKDYGMSVRKEPMGVTFWKGGRRIHGVFQFNPSEV